MLAISFKESDSYYSSRDVHTTLMLLKTLFFPFSEQGTGREHQASGFLVLASTVLFLSELRPYGHINPMLGGSEI